MNINELREKVKNRDFDDNELIDLILHLERENQVLLEENKKYKEVIDKVIKELNDYLNINTVIRDELLDILKEMKK